MPRKYTRKTDKSAYSTEKLQEAIEAVKNGTMSAYTASKHYSIPRPTIVNRIHGRRGLKSNTLGRSTILSHDVEESLAKNLHIMEKYGFGLTRKEIFEVVGEYVHKNCIVNPFKDGVPGEDWFLGFKKRHGLSVKKPQPVEYARKNACRPEIIYPYFDLLENTVNELHLHDKPSHIYNLDETSFSKDPSKSKVVGLKGFTSTRTISSPGKDNTTVLLGCNASGEKLPPLIIYKGKNVWDEWTSQEAYPGTVYAATPNGWMESQVFESFFDKVFLPTVGQKRPILLIYDGHSTHVGLNIIEKARAAGITILKIPPHTSDVLQPLDLSVNKSFKDKWDAALVKWQRHNIGKVLPKKDFAKMLGQIWTAVERSVCAAGFRKAGIFPLNKNAVPQEKFNQILLQAWRSKTTVSEEPGENLDSTFFHEIWTDTCCSDDNVNLGFQQQQDEVCSNQPQLIDNQPEPLQKIVLSSINKIIAVSHAGISQQSSSVHREKSLLLEQKPTSSMSLASVTSNNISDSSYVRVPKHAKITILENRLVSFEELLLKSVKGGTSIKTKKRKIGTGAELITNDDVYKRCKLIEAEKEQKVKEKEQKAMEKEEKSKVKELLKKSKQENNTVTNIKKEKQVNKKTDSLGLCTTLQEKTFTSGDNTPRQHKPSKRVGKQINCCNKENTKCKINTKKRNKKIYQIQESDGSTTSVSDLMSEHSDSSIYDVDFNDEDGDIVFSPSTSGRRSLNNSIASVAFPSNSSVNRRVNPPDSTGVVLNEKTDGNDTSSFTKQGIATTSNIPQICESYVVKDTVLVRYFMKGSWKYYIGVVTACNDNQTYDISFYTTIRKKGELTFKMPTKKDRDTVPEESVVKIIQISKISDKPEIYTLGSQNDKVYF